MTKKLLGPIFTLAVGALAGAANAPAVQADADSFTYTTDDGNGGGERASAAARGADHRAWRQCGKGQAEPIAPSAPF